DRGEHLDLSAKPRDLAREGVQLAERALEERNQLVRFVDGEDLVPDSFHALGGTLTPVPHPCNRGWILRGFRGCPSTIQSPAGTSCATRRSSRGPYSPPACPAFHGRKTPPRPKRRSWGSARSSGTSSIWRPSIGS